LKRDRGTWENTARRPLRSVAASLALVLAVCVNGLAQDEPLSEEIQRNREAMERKRAQYHEERAQVADFNARVERYKELRESLPFSSVPGTTNIVQMYVNRHDVRAVARMIYGITNDASDAGFINEYWPSFLVLNQAHKYDGGIPLYGELDPEHPEENVAVFPNIRKRGLQAAVARVDSTDILFAQNLSQPAVVYYRRRLVAEVERLVLDVGVPDPPTRGVQRLSGETRMALFRKLPEATRDVYPPRRITDTTLLAAANRAERDPVHVNQEINLEPAPPAWALRQEITALGTDYQGYDIQYEPGNFQLQPEGGAMAFYGGRNAKGESAIQPGVYFSFNQKIFHFLLFNETAFAAFSASDAPPVNGGTLNTGIDVDVGPLNFAGLVGVSAFNVAGETASGPSFTGKLRWRVTPRMYVGAVYTISHAEVSVAKNPVRSGVVNPGFVGLSLTVR